MGVPNIKIQYSTDLGLSWNIISNSYPASQHIFSWTLPIITSLHTLIKISDVSDSTISDVSDNPFIICQPKINTQNPTSGYINLNFGPTNVSLEMDMYTPAPINVTYYDNVTPPPSTLPPSFYGIRPYYWIISAPESIYFNMAFIKVPVSLLGGEGSKQILWLKRSNSNYSWTTLWGEIINGNIVNLIPFNVLGEFAIGFYNDNSPVELAGFSANTNNDLVSLIWSTVTETNNRGFEILRKSSTYDFITVAFINGKGTATKPNNYSWSEKLQPGIYSYRIKQVDFDGKFEYSKEVEVVVVPKDFSLEQNFPNPFNPSTVIRYNIPVESSICIKVFNSLGENVREFNVGTKQPGFYELNFNSMGLASGVYFYSVRAISIIGKKDFSAVKKMMILK